MSHLLHITYIICIIKLMNLPVYNIAENKNKTT